MSWDQRFAEPIVLDDGSKLSTLREAIAHLGKIIPQSEHDMPDVQTAADLLTKVAEHGGPVEFARIATLRAISRHAVRVLILCAKTRNGASVSLRGINDGGSQKSKAPDCSEARPYRRAGYIRPRRHQFLCRHDNRLPNRMND